MNFHQQRHGAVTLLKPEGPLVEAAAGEFDQAATMVFNAGSQGWLMGSQFLQGQVSGVGNVDRSQSQYTVTTDVVTGFASVVFNPPYISPATVPPVQPYQVVLTQVDAAAVGPATAVPVVVSKTQAGTTFYGIPGATYDVSILLASSPLSIA